VSGRYDHYSEGFSHFSPKVGVKFTPIKQLAFRGTYSQGFRAPTFAESGPRSQYAGFVTTVPPCNFQVAHGGILNPDGTCSANGNPYNLAYSLGRGVVGNPNLQPETSRSFTARHDLPAVPVAQLHGRLLQCEEVEPDRRRSGHRQGGHAYFAAANGSRRSRGRRGRPGLFGQHVDGIDPQFPNALPRVLIINVPS
jgi:iron complex outermembrane receptor protein